MALDLVPSRFWGFPNNRWLSSFWDDLDVEPVTETGGGLTVSEDDKHVYVEAALPGIDPDAVEVTFDKGILYIRGEAKSEEKDKEKTFYRRAQKSYAYRVAVPGDVDHDHEPEAVSDHGVMKVVFNKAKQAQPKKIKVKKAVKKVE